MSTPGELVRALKEQLGDACSMQIVSRTASFGIGVFLRYVPADIAGFMRNVCARDAAVPYCPIGR